MTRSRAGPKQGDDCNVDVNTSHSSHVSKLIIIRIMMDFKFPSASLRSCRPSGGGGCGSSSLWRIVGQVVEISEGIVNVWKRLEVKNISVLRRWLKSLR